ncbi:NADPH-dependent FMN reductase [Actinophytocola sediminis]
MIRIAVIVGSTRPRRRTEVAADWVVQIARRHPEVVAGKVEIALVDLVDYGLPLLDEPVSAAWGDYRKEHTRRWAETVDSFDGFVFVTPEYNHSIPAALKNAIDFLFAEWQNKAAGFVSHGTGGGLRAVEHLRLVLAEVKVAGVRAQVGLEKFTDFTISEPGDPGVLTPGQQQEPTLVRMLDELFAWSRALAPLRAPAVPA